MNKNLRISIVIPVYNEAELLAACLRAIDEQTLAPFEVIVVDNNSTDDTAAITATFPFVRLVRARRQGVVHARNSGFDAAAGDIIGRIDADTMLPPDWVQHLTDIFADPSITGVSGAITYRDILFTDFFAAVELFFRQWVANGFGDQSFLYGSNMAIRRDCWQAVRGSVCLNKGLHEDLDLGIHARSASGRIVFDRRLHAEIHLRRFDTNFINFWQWAWLTPRTYSKHGLHEQRRMYAVAALATVCYLPLKLLHKLYDVETQKLSLQKLFISSVQRVNPATFVD